MTTEREAFEVWHAEWRARVSARDPTPTEAWFAACAWRKEKDAKLCEAYAIDRHALYKGKPPYTGKEPGRYDFGSDWDASMSNLSARSREQVIDENYEAFQTELPRILIAHAGKVALMHDRKIEGIYTTAVEAIREGKNRYPDRMFSVQSIEKPQPVELGWFSHIQGA